MDTTTYQVGAVAMINCHRAQDEGRLGWPPPQHCDDAIPSRLQEVTKYITGVQCEIGFVARHRCHDTNKKNELLVTHTRLC